MCQRISIMFNPNDSKYKQIEFVGFQPETTLDGQKAEWDILQTLCGETYYVAKYTSKKGKDYRVVLTTKDEVVVRAVMVWGLKSTNADCHYLELTITPQNNIAMADLMKDIEDDVEYTTMLEMAHSMNAKWGFFQSRRYLLESTCPTCGAPRGIREITPAQYRAYMKAGNKFSFETFDVTQEELLSAYGYNIEDYYGVVLDVSIECPSCR